MDEVKAAKTGLTDEQVIDQVRNFRNDLIKDFLDERHLKNYLADQFGVRDLTAIKIEFIKKDLKELLISPVDLIRYLPVIEHIKQMEQPSLNNEDQAIFHKDLDQIFKRYMYY